MTNKTTVKTNGIDIQAIIAKAVADALAQATAQSKAETTAIASEIARLKAENAALAAKPAVAVERPLTFRVSDKGAVSVYGLGQFPATYYKSQWKRIFKAQKELEAFMVANDAKLATKPVK